MQENKFNIKVIEFVDQLVDKLLKPFNNIETNLCCNKKVDLCYNEYKLLDFSNLTTENYCHKNFIYEIKFKSTINYGKFGGLYILKRTNTEYGRIYKEWNRKNLNNQILMYLNSNFNWSGFNITILEEYCTFYIRLPNNFNPWPKIKQIMNCLSRNDLKANWNFDSVINIYLTNDHILDLQNMLGTKIIYPDKIKKIINKEVNNDYLLPDLNNIVKQYLYV